MLTLAEIREDLKDIKYYYMRKKIFDKAFESTGVVNDVTMKVEKYNNAVKSASPKFYDLYVSLYINNHTQESLSELMGFTPEYIQQLNKRLLKFFQSKFDGEKEDNINENN